MASYLPDLSRDNISFYLIPAAWAIALMPRVFAANTYKKASNKDMNTLQPRDFVKNVLEDQSVDSKTKGRIVRAEAAQANGFENLGLFAAAVAAGNAARLDASVMNGLSIGYVVSRFIYNHIYIFNDIVPPVVRSLTYMGGVGMCMALFVQAGTAMKNSLL